MSHLLSLYYEHHNKVCMFPDYTSWQRCYQSSSSTWQLVVQGIITGLPTVCVVIYSTLQSWSNRTSTDLQCKKVVSYVQEATERCGLQYWADKTRDRNSQQRNHQNYRDKKEIWNAGLSFCSIVELHSLLYFRNEACYMMQETCNQLL